MLYIPCLHGLRAVAVVMVLLSHIARVPNISNWLYETLNFAYFGLVGVRIFFILSGYLITHVLVSEWNSTGSISIKNFFFRRVLRIFPCFFAYLLILLLLRYGNIIDIEYQAILLAFLYAQNWNVFQNTPAFATSWLVAHSWSLSVEEQFYLIYPFVFKKIEKLFSTRLLLHLMIVITIGTFFRALNYSFPEISKLTGGPFFMNADFLLVGVALRWWLPNNKTTLQAKLKYPKDVLLVASIFAMLLASRYEYKSAINLLICSNIELISITYLISYILLFPQSRLGMLFEQPIFVYVGKISYSIYVWQQLFLGSSELWLNYPYFTHLPLNLVMTFACAVLSYYLIEKPFLRMKDRFSSRTII